MRKKNFKGRCEKRVLGKCAEVCRTYDAIQYAYCDGLGVLVEEYPSFYQFRYFYRKTRNLQNFYISRDGVKNYQRNNRPLVGEGVQEFAPAVGTGMFDATVCDGKIPPQNWQNPRHASRGKRQEPAQRNPSLS